MERTIKPDIVAQVRFYANEEGGRKEPTGKDFFGCPLLINNQYYDCRLLLFEIGAVYSGQTVIVPIKFLDSQTVLQFIKVGDEFWLWDRRIFAEGKVIELAT